MRAFCQHGVAYGVGCAACETELDARDPSTIDGLESAFLCLADVYGARGVTAIGRADDLRRAADYHADAFALAVVIHGVHGRAWHSRHDSGELGGEA